MRQALITTLLDKGGSRMKYTLDEIRQALFTACLQEK